MDVKDEISKLEVEIKRLGTAQADGSYTVTFGKLVRDDKVANIFEALVGTLKAAKKKKIIKYDSELLLSPTHDNVIITLMKQP